MSNVSWPTNEDLKMLGKMPKDMLLGLFFLHNKNLWRVDGLYFLGIEERFGPQNATEIDADCWEMMGKTEARELKEILGLDEINVKALLYTLRNTSWALYQTDKMISATANHGVFKVKHCRTQETRIRKGLSEFPCKKVRYGYLQNFTQEFNPKIKVVCKKCPPDPHVEGVWCEWEFALHENGST